MLIKRIFPYILIFIAPLLIFYFIYVYGYKVPFWDQWPFAAVFLQKFYTGHLTFSDFWMQHNEHRIIFPKLIMLALAYFSNWNIAYERYMNFFLAGLILMFLYSLYKRSTSNSISLWMAVAFSFLVFSIVQWENWIWGWQVPIYLNVLATVVSVWAVVRWRGQLKGVLIAGGAAIIASYSFISGLLTWIIVSVPLFQQNQRKRNFTLWISMFLLTVISFYYRYSNPSHHLTSVRFMNQPIEYIEYVLAYVGAPLGFLTQDFALYKKIAIIIALLLLTILFASAIWIWRTNKKDFYNLGPWFSLALYSLLSAAVTAIGRSGFGVEQALSSRYTTISTLLVISSLVVVNVSFKNLFDKYKNLSIGLVVLFSLVFVLFVSSYALTFLNAKKLLIERSLIVNNAGLCLQDIDLATDDCLKILYIDTELVREQTKALKKNNLLREQTFQGVKIEKGGMIYINEVNSQSYESFKRDVSIDLYSNRTLTINGWAIDYKNKNAGETVYLVLRNKDNEIIVPAKRENRQDVASYFGTNDYLQAGWTCTLRTIALRPACYNLSVRLLRKGGNVYWELEGRKPICFHRGH